MNPNNWQCISIFLVFATLLSVGVGWLIKKEALPLKSIMAYSEAQLKFIKVWVNVALVIGVILPMAMLIVFWKQQIPRQFFIYYLLVVFIQLASEIGFSRWLCKSVVVIIGSIYTVFRIWQLWMGIHLINSPQPWLSLLWLVWLFWVANIIMLLTMAFPTIFPEAEENF